MSTAGFRVGVEAGDGLVARFGASVIVADATTGMETFTMVVLNELDAVEDASVDLAWRISELLVSHRATAPDFGLVLTLPDSVQILLHGSVRAVVNGEMELTGRDALTWVDRIFPNPVTSVAITLAPDGPAQVDPRSDLRGGLVSGAGFVLTARPHVGHPTSAIEPVDEEMPTPPAAKPVEPAGETVMVKNALTTLVADDGTRILLDRRYVFGREPQHDESVVSGAASPIRLADPEHLISRVQAYVFVDANGVTVRDAKSANGTYIAAPGASEWDRLGDQASALPLGWSIRVGRRVFTHVET